MALAIRFEQLIRDGVVADQAELARLSHVTRARLTQIMNLSLQVLLPPGDIGFRTRSNRNINCGSRSNWQTNVRELLLSGTREV